MEEESQPSRSLNFFKWVLFVFGILTTLGSLAAILGTLRPRSGQSYPQPLLTSSAVAAVLFFTAFLAVQYRIRYARWLAVLTFALADCNVIYAVLWHFFVYNGRKSMFGAGMVIVQETVQFVLFSLGALTFAFPPKVNTNDAPAESLLPPPPPTFE